MTSDSFKPLIDDLADVQSLGRHDFGSLVDAQARIVEYIASNAPLDETLTAIADELEAVWPDAKAAFLMTMEEPQPAVTTGPTVSPRLATALRSLSGSVLLNRVDERDPFTPTQLTTDASERERNGFTEALHSSGLAAAWFSLVTPIDDLTPSWLVLFVSDSQAMTDGEIALVRRFAHLSRVAIGQHRRELELHQLIADERQRIAGVIHDDPIQALTVVGLRIQRLARHVDGDAAAQVAELHVAVATAIDRMRRLLIDLHPPKLDDDGLVSAIDEYVGEVLEPLGIQCSLQEVVDGELSLGAASLAYRLVVEALWNVVKHADATKVDLTVKIEAGSVEVQITDDGRGFDSARVSRQRAGHMGISACRELAVRASGSWRVESSVGGGTTVTVFLPGAAPIDVTEQVTD